MKLLYAYLYGKHGASVPSRLSMREALIAKALFGGGGGTLTELTGQTSPISLPDALAKKLKSLLQYGKVSQASTPSPGSPVDIYCNNGKLVMIDDELPAGYKRVASINFDGDFHYETGEAMSGDDDVTMTLADTKTTGQNIFGSYNGTSSGTKNFSLFIYGGGSASNSYLRYGEQLLRPKYGTGERTITFGKSGTSGFATDVSATPEEFTTPANAFIGMLPNSTSPSFSGTIVGNILFGTRLKYIPCERQSDGAVGYYEVVKGVFLEPVGTGTPTAGSYDHTHETVLAVVGTPEVITLGTQTASAANLLAAGSFADTQNIVTGAITRKVKALVLTGDETWGKHSSNERCYTLQPSDCKVPSSARTADIICTHYPVSTGSPGGSAMPDGTCQLSRQSSISTVGMLVFKRPDITSPSGFQNWLRAQYANGTPVIVIYPLKEEITEKVAAQALTCAEGDNTITVTAEVSGVEFDVTYYAAEE